MTPSAKLRKIRHLDPVLTLATLGLLALGTVMVFSSSSSIGAEKFGDSAYYLKRHLIWMAIGGLGMGVTFFINPFPLKKLATPALIGGLILLGLVMVTGTARNKAVRWLNLGGLVFQPSEFVKLTVVLYTAAYLAKARERIQKFSKGLLPLLATVGGIVLVLLKEPDFGTAVLVTFVVAMMVFVGGANLWHVGALGALAGVASYALILSSAYRRRRLMAFLHPWQDPLGSGFQILQSFIAFQNGGFQGQGLGDGTQKLLYLPEMHTDFIFAVIAEELGFLGSFLVIFLFALIVIQGFRLSLRLREPFTSSLALGLTGLIGFQAFFHMAVVMGLVPTKGLTLPFISYGGSSLVITLMSIGLLLSLSATLSMTTSMARRRVR
ncbi:MAG TPA: putative lipid II flippase FtsW [Bdellovibrionota bacterium]|nr:putative lipid II flippase FtsW [Bdellovibrionota bacterium]